MEFFKSVSLLLQILVNFILFLCFIVAFLSIVVSSGRCLKCSVVLFLIILVVLTAFLLFFCAAVVLSCLFSCSSMFCCFQVFFRCCFRLFFTRAPFRCRLLCGFFVWGEIHHDRDVFGLASTLRIMVPFCCLFAFIPVFCFVCVFYLYFCELIF